MTAIRSYIHSIITHIAIDWMGPVSCGLKMECCSLPWRLVLCTWGRWNTPFTLVLVVNVWKRRHIYTTDVPNSLQRPHTESIPITQGEWMPWTNMHYWQVTLYMKNSEPVRLCYYTMEMRPFSYHFGNEMTSMRSYFHSIIRHTATDWLAAFRVISKQNAVDFTDA